MQTLSVDDWNAFPFATTRDVVIAGHPARATRVSFVGELGWEISATVDHAGAVFDALRAAGARPMGHYALDGCRMEKGFRHWGHDLGPETAPLEAGLGFAIDWRTDFLGRAALEQQRRDGITRRLCLFEVQSHPLVLHDEPIWQGGAVVGLTTSGARGPRTGLTLALGLIGMAPGVTLSETCTREFEIEVAGKRYPARALQQPPFDPKGERMRA